MPHMLKWPGTFPSHYIIFQTGEEYKSVHSSCNYEIFLMKGGDVTNLPVCLLEGSQYKTVNMLNRADI